VSVSDRSPHFLDDQPLPTSSPLYPYGFAPWTASWKTWYFPGAWTGNRHSAMNGGKIDEDWNLYEHLGGNGPWIQKRNGVVANDTTPPDDCTVQQVHMVSILGLYQSPHCA